MLDRIGLLLTHLLLRPVCFIISFYFFITSDCAFGTALYSTGWSCVIGMVFYAWVWSVKPRQYSTTPTRGTAAPPSSFPVCALLSLAHRSYTRTMYEFAATAGA